MISFPKNRRLLLTVIIGLLIAVSVLALVILLKNSSLRSASPISPQTSLAPNTASSPSDAPLHALSASPLPQNGVINVLLLGYGGAGHDGAYLTDSMTLINIQTNKKIVNIISIPRDLYVSIPVDWDNTKDNKINFAYAAGVDDGTFPNKLPEFRKKAAGGGNLADYVVGNVTGLSVNYFVSVDFSKYVDIINLLGGLDVNVPTTFEDNFYPIKGLENETCGFTPEQIDQYKASYSGFDLESKFTCRYEKLHFDKGMVKMDGDTALKYVRSRHSDQSGGDFARSARQHSILVALKDKILSAGIVTQANPVFQKLFQSVNTNLSVNSILEISTKIASPGDFKINHIYLTTGNVLMDARGPGGAAILLPKLGLGNYTDIRKYISDNSN